MLERTRSLGAALTVLTLAVTTIGACPAARAADHHTIILTLVRHAQSAANAAEIIDTSVPGPDITPLGDGQALNVANELSTNRYDGIYASTMIRTQETAAPLSQALGEPVTVLPSLREIEAGQNEGLPEANAPQYPAPRAGCLAIGLHASRDPSTVTNSSRASTTQSKRFTTPARQIPSHSPTVKPSCSGF